MPTSSAGPYKRSGAKKAGFVVIAAVLTVVGYFGFRMIRGLMMLGYVDSTIGQMRVLYGAEKQFAKEHPERGYTCNLSELPRTGEVQRLLTGNGVDNGYTFEIAGCQAPDGGKPNSAYYTSARPLHSGQPAFCSDQSGILRADYSGSIEKCRANGLPVLADVTSPLHSSTFGLGMMSVKHLVTTGMRVQSSLGLS
jgi:hypothetical protein